MFCLASFSVFTVAFQLLAPVFRLSIKLLTCRPAALNIEDVPNISALIFNTALLASATINADLAVFSSSSLSSGNLDDSSFRRLSSSAELVAVEPIEILNCFATFSCALSAASAFSGSALRIIPIACLAASICFIVPLKSASFPPSVAKDSIDFCMAGPMFLVRSVSAIREFRSFVFCSLFSSLLGPTPIAWNISSLKNPPIPPATPPMIPPMAVPMGPPSDPIIAPREAPPIIPLNVSLIRSAFISESTFPATSPLAVAKSAGVPLAKALSNCIPWYDTKESIIPCATAAAAGAAPTTPFASPFIPLIPILPMPLAAPPTPAPLISLALF